VLHSQVEKHLIAQGFDPTIGLSHCTDKNRDALVLDQMEPLRPIVDGVTLKLALKDRLSPADFTMTREGFCRLNPQLARNIAGKTIEGTKI
jgi:CRISP-associated protein Cas1